MIREDSNVCPAFIKYLSGLYIIILIFVKWFTNFYQFINLHSCIHISKYYEIPTNLNQEVR